MYDMLGLQVRVTLQGRVRPAKRTLGHWRHDLGGDCGSQTSPCLFLSLPDQEVSDFFLCCWCLAMMLPLQRLSVRGPRGHRVELLKLRATGNLFSKLITPGIVTVMER